MPDPLPATGGEAVEIIRQSEQGDGTLYAFVASKAVDDLMGSMSGLRATIEQASASGIRLTRQLVWLNPVTAAATAVLAMVSFKNEIARILGLLKPQ